MKIEWRENASVQPGSKLQLSVIRAFNDWDSLSVMEMKIGIETEKLS